MKRVLVLMVACLLLFGACSGGTKKQAQRAGEDVKAVASAVASKAKAVTTAETVKLQNIAYNPQRVQVKVGQEVKWVNRDSFTHTVTSENNSFNSGDLGTDKDFSFRFTQAGTYTYYCQIHGKNRMSGSVVVQ